MTRAELDQLLARLRGTWPGEWDEERCAVWIETLNEHSYATATAAIRAMARRETFPSINKFVDYAQAEIGVSHPNFMFGTGELLRDLTANRVLPPEALELDDARDRDVVPIDEARRRIREVLGKVTKPVPDDRRSS